MGSIHQKKNDGTYILRGVGIGPSFLWWVLALPYRGCRLVLFGNTDIQDNEFTGGPREEHQNRMQNERGHDVLDFLEGHKKWN